MFLLSFSRKEFKNTEGLQTRLGIVCINFGFTLLSADTEMEKINPAFLHGLGFCQRVL